MTDQPEPDRIPLAHSVHYVVRGMPEVPNQYGPGVLRPSEITLTYRAAPDSQLGRVHAYVAGRIWADGKELPLLPGGLYGQHYFDGLDGWPEWLADEARLHDPAAVSSVGQAPTPNRTAITADELAHALDNSTPYPVELDQQLCGLMAVRLLEMLTIGKRPEHAVWQPEDEPEVGEQPQPEDPAAVVSGRTADETRGETRPSCPDPIECGHEAALGLAEMRLDQVRAKAAEWTALAPPDDWGNTPQDTQLADVGRYLLGLLDGAKPVAASDSRANTDVPAVGGAQQPTEARP